MVQVIVQILDGYWLLVDWIHMVVRLLTATVTWPMQCCSQHSPNVLLVQRTAGTTCINIKYNPDLAGLQMQVTWMLSSVHGTCACALLQLPKGLRDLETKGRCNHRPFNIDSPFEWLLIMMIFRGHDSCVSSSVSLIIDANYARIVVSNGVEDRPMRWRNHLDGWMETEASWLRR